MSIKPIEYHDGVVRMIDQRLLPTRELWLEYRDYRTVAEAIQTMVIRGAPAIGVAAAYGAALGARDIDADTFETFYAELEQVCATLAATRPTAVNLFWALDRMKAKARELSRHPLTEVKVALMNEAQTIADDDITINRTMGRHGAQLIADGSRILTHCNAGALATGGYGTALGVIRAAVESGKTISVLADETRPFLQGSRLTAWELHKDGIPVTLICDNMAGTLMRQGEIDCVIVGADRIAANFYVAAPLSTIDLNIPNGDHIPIEERDAIEVTHCGQTRLAPEGIKVRNPAFDVTPARLVSAIITERGVVSGDYETELANLFKES